MDYIKIGGKDYDAFHKLMVAYYREGEDADTPQEELDGFIRLLFDQVIRQQISGCFAMAEGDYIGFALWGKDTEDFAFSQMPGLGTILEIGLLPSYRGNGRGKELVAYIEACLQAEGMAQCYVSAYGPAQRFWAGCGYAEIGRTAGNELPLMVKNLTREN